MITLTPGMRERLLLLTAVDMYEKSAKIEFTQPVAVTLRDCLALYYQQTSKLIEKAEGLRSGTAEPEELQQELKALHLKLGDSGTKPLDYVEGSEQTSLLPDAGADKGGVDGNGTLPPKAANVKPLTGVPD